MPADSRLLAVSLLVLGGFSAILSRGAPNGPDVKWVTFHDPLEKAFTIDVPQGWTANGGMFRLGYSDYRPMLDLRSPDGRINIRSGDVAIPSYAVPTPYKGEGELDDLGDQAQLTFARYRTGKEFAELYALTHFKTVCQSLTPQETDQSAPVLDAAVSGAQTSTGAVLYRCDSGQGARLAYVYARTTASGGPHPALWQVSPLVSYVAPAEDVSRVRAILVHASQSFKLLPEWIEYQKKMDAQGYQYQVARQRQRMAELGRQVQEFEARMQSMRNQVKAFQTRQNAQAKQVESFTNALNGLTPTIDPLSGETRKVWTGPGSGYWKNGVGTIVNSNTSPGPGFHPLQTPP